MKHLRIKLMTCIIITICVMTECDHNKDAGISIPEEEWEAGSGELSNHIGQQSDPVKQPLTYNFNNEDLFEQTDYDPPSGKWFLHNGSGKFGYVQTRDTKRIGSEYVFSLISHEREGEKLDRDIRIQLTKHDSEYNLLEMINEELIHVDEVSNLQEIFKDRLPMEENVSYVFSAEILDKNGYVEDTMVTQIFVPKVEMNVNLMLDQTILKASDQHALLNIENFGPTILSIGTYYTIEKMIDDVWKVVPLEYVFTDIGIFINPGNTYGQKIDIEQLSPGHYRVIKEIHASGTQLSQTLAKTFEIE